jgi:hypothetical protein
VPDTSAVSVVIGGVNLTRFARVGRVRIDDVLNDAPNTAALTIILAPRYGPFETGPFAPHAFDHGGFNTQDNHAPQFPPPPVTVGAPIGIYLNGVADQIFGGEILTREQYAEFDHPPHVRLDLSCIDHTRRLNRRVVVKEYGAASATAIVLDVMANYAPSIATSAVEAGLPTIDGGITFTFEEVSRSLSRIAEKIGAYWYVDYAAVLHFFTGTEAGPTPDPIVPGGRFADLKITADLSQVRTRIIVEGDGGTATVTLTAGDSITPISQTTPFNPAGGMAKIGPTRVTYTGIHDGAAKTNTTGTASGGTPGTPGGPPPTPPGALTATLASATTAGGLAGGPYYYAVTFELSDGSRSALGTAAGPVTIGAATGPPPTTAALFNPPTKGPIVVGVTSTYATSYADATGRETAATLGGTQLTGGGRPVDTPSGFAASFINTNGTIAPGYYDYAVTFLTPGGETLPSFARSVNLSIQGAVRITLPWANAAAVVDGRIVGRRVYRSTVNPSTVTTVLPWHHVVDVPGNTPNQQFDDTMADAYLSTKNYPAFSTATDIGEAAAVTLPVSADPRIVQRRLYRKDGPGEYRLVARIPDNTATTFNDVVVGPGGDLAPTSNQINTGAVNLSNIPLGPALTVARRVFRTTAGGSQYRELVTINNNTATTYTDTEGDATLGGSPLPAQGTPGTAGTPSGQIPPTLAGADRIQVSSLTGFPAAGWAVVESVLIRYTGTSSSGGFFLTGIPASGPGAVAADIAAGTVLTLSPALVGVSPVVPVTLGDAIQLIAQVDDLAAQAAIAAIEGGDGIIEFYIQDRRLSEAGARARGLAELELFKTVETQLSYTTHDVNTRSGRTVHVALPAPTNLTGDFLIQRVTIDDVSTAANYNPRRKVDASTTRFSFEDVLNRILLEQH